MLAGQDVLGTLTISHPRPGVFNRYHLNVLETLADLATTALLQTRQQEAFARQAQLHSIVVEVGRALCNTTDLSQVLSLTTAGIRRLIACEEAVLFSYEAATQELRGVAGLGTQSARLAEQRIAIGDTHSVTAWVARQSRPLLHSSGSRAFVGRLTDTLLTRADLALLAVPLLAQNQLWGVITLARPEPFDTHDLRIMLSLSSFVAPSLAYAQQAEANR
jgi:GAF domain-containing protein